MPRLTHVAAIALVLALSACGNKSSRQDLEAKISELEDENDLLKQQLADARLQAEEAMVAAERAKGPTPAFAPPMIPLAPDVPADLLVDSREEGEEASDPAPRRAGSNAGAAAAAAAEAAETARQALGN
ncbi:hypothetical protein WG901_10620 [Novosphingobium sp. PS1R-30]|uniref:Secreted protein n=1 Tax=Novosphingobium anseongense TaxID=3133436 RepID=A0ABU8RWE1_9SPHN